MKIHHLRNATFIIEAGINFILVDPMLGKKGELPPLAFIRHKRVRNPLVPLPENSRQILDKVTHCLITHCQKGHIDHLDQAGKDFLQRNNISVICNAQDAAYLQARDINVELPIDSWQSSPLLGGRITAIPAQHGRGLVSYFMANGVGFYLQLPAEPSIYISGDTVYTNAVDHALVELNPDIAIVAAGAASLDVGKPILMSLEEIITFINTAPHKVIANHLEALNHCPMTRVKLKQTLQEQDILYKTLIPNDGDILIFNSN